MAKTAFLLKKYSLKMQFFKNCIYFHGCLFTVFIKNGVNSFKNTVNSINVSNISLNSVILVKTVPSHNWVKFYRQYTVSVSDCLLATSVVSSSINVAS